MSMPVTRHSYHHRAVNTVGRHSDRYMEGLRMAEPTCVNAWAGCCAPPVHTARRTPLQHGRLRDANAYALGGDRVALRAVVPMRYGRALVDLHGPPLSSGTTVNDNTCLERLHPFCHNLGVGCLHMMARELGLWQHPPITKTKQLGPSTCSTEWCWLQALATSRPPRGASGSGLTTNASSPDGIPKSPVAKIC